MKPIKRTALSSISTISPRRVYVMQEVDGQNVSDKVLMEAEGLVIRARWKSVEPKDGQFNLTFIKGQIDRAERMGKKIHLQVLGGDECPSWLKTAGAKYGSGMPLPWDAVYQAQYLAMSDVLRAKLSFKNVTHYHIPGADNSEWFYKDYGIYSHREYTDVKMVKAHVDWVRGLADRMPGIIITCDIADHDKKWTQEAIKQMKANFKGIVGFQMDSLSAKTQTGYLGYTRIRDAAREGHHAGFEMVGPSVTRKGQAVSRFGGLYSTAIAKANSAIGDKGWLCPYQDDLRFVQR